MKNRSCKCDNSCIDHKIGKVEFISFSGKAAGCGGIVGDDLMLKPNSVQYAQSQKNINRIDKETVPLEQVLYKHHTPATIDYLSLDVEGSEWRDLEKFSIRRI